MNHPTGAEPASPVVTAATNALGARGRLFVGLCVGSLFVGLFADVLARDRNLFYRDAGHFYYPYFKLIADEWRSGRIPLWNPHENGGEPLAANPTASVFYPGKLLFLLSYPAAFKIYHVGHVALAWVCCFVAARWLTIGPWGSAFAATAYAFSGFVLFQIYNVVFLVGAAWLPLGLACVDRLARAPNVAWLVLFAIVLAMQVLGGDPQVAMMTGLVAIPRLLLHHLGVGRGLLLCVAILGLGFAVLHGPEAGANTGQALIRLFTLSGLAGNEMTIRRAWDDFWAAGLALGVALVAFAGSTLTIWRARNALAAQRPLLSALGLTAGAAALATLLAAVQIFPTMQLVNHSDRKAPDAPHEPMAFSLFPLRIAELIVPACFGRQFPTSTRWAPFQAIETGVWTPTLYCGLLPAVLGLTSIRLKRGDSQSIWLGWILLLMFWISIGKFGGMLWWTDKGRQPAAPGKVAAAHGALYGTSDGLYRVCEETVPGFRSFRYPSKAFVFCALALALLAGRGLELWIGESDRRVQKCLCASAVLVAVVMFPCLHWIDGLDPLAATHRSSFGPLDKTGASREFVRSAGHFSAVAIVALLVFEWCGRRLVGARAAAVFGLLCFDLLIANRWLIFSDEQSAIDAKPAVLEAIEREEAKDAASDHRAPFRIHRTRTYHPLSWILNSSSTRDVEMAQWERRTLQPKYGVARGAHYATTVGTMSIYDVEFFFAPWTVKLPELLRDQLQKANAPAPDVLVYFPRQGYNLWNTRYFVLPRLMKPDDEDRGTFTFLYDSDGTPCTVISQSPADQDDYVVLKNAEAFPRAWIVHSAEFRDPIKGLSRVERASPCERLLYRRRDAGLQLWPGPVQSEYPLRDQVMLEVDEPRPLAPFLSVGTNRATEAVHFDDYAADRIQMRVRMGSPGFLVLADAFYPGWSATIDGHTRAPVLRANRAMRAVPLPAGELTIDWRYRSLPFEVGAAISATAWIGVLFWCIVKQWRRVHRTRTRQTPANASG